MSDDTSHYPTIMKLRTFESANKLLIKAYDKGHKTYLRNIKNKDFDSAQSNLDSLNQVNTQLINNLNNKNVSTNNNKNVVNSYLQYINSFYSLYYDANIYEVHLFQHDSYMMFQLNHLLNMFDNYYIHVQLFYH